MDSVQAVDQRQQSQAIVDAMADAVIVVDAGGRITDFNPAARDLLGEFAIADRPLSGFVELLRPAASNGDPVRTEELPPVRALAGEVVREWECSAGLPAGERQLTLSASPIRDPRGTILGAVTVLRDVTAARLAECAQDRFLSVASHELKTPLSPLRIYIQYLQ
jgi:PAS domain-containing protein